MSSQTLDGHSCRVTVLSWNVGNAQPPADLSEWVKGEAAEGSEFVVVGVQECRFSTDAKSKDAKKGKKRQVAKVMRPRAVVAKIKATVFWGVVEQSLPGYEKVASGRRFEMSLRVYALKTVVALVRNVCVSNEATGLGGVVGNKGGIAISFRYLDNSFCFVSAHFAAHQDRLEDRRQNYREIVRNLRIGRKAFDLVNQFDYLFWMGDLNYRVDLPFDEALPLASRPTPESLTRLYQHDQLQRELDQQHVFHGFSAPVPSFPPTYRMKKGAREYNPELARIPSWTDRVLFATNPNPYFQPLLREFSSVPSVVTSDHTPIRAVFSTPLRAPLPSSSSSSSSSDQPLRFQLKLSQLKGHGLFPADRNGLSDPYLKFSSPGLLASKARTEIISKTLDPEWTREILLPVTASVSRPAIEQGVLYIQVYDNDNHSRDDRMGETRLSLDGLSSDPLSFSLSVIHSGQSWGIITGVIQLLTF